MVDARNEELEAFMNRRAIPQPSSNLAERIIEASLHHKKQGKTGAELWWHSFWDAFLLPQPVFVLACIFVLGLFIGAYADLIGVSTETDQQVSVLQMLYTADDIAEEDWL